MERRKAPASFKRGCGTTEYGRALSALHPLDLFEGQGKLRESGAGVTAYPGPVKNAGDDVRLLVIPGRAKREPGIQGQFGTRLWIPGSVLRTAPE